MEQRKKGESELDMPLRRKSLNKNIIGETLTKIIETSFKLTPRPVKITTPEKLQLTSFKVETIDKNTEVKKNQLQKETIPKVVEYSFDPSGRLICNKNVYSRVSISGNCIRYKCSERLKKKCLATLKTIGKEVVIINKDHTHENKFK